MFKLAFQCEWLLAVAVLSGCAGGQSAHDPFPEIENAPPLTTGLGSEASDKATPPVTVEMNGSEPVATGPTPDVAETVEADLLAIGEMDPEEKQRLLAERDQHKASLWPSIVRQRRAALAYRREQLEREDTRSPSAVGSSGIEHAANPSDKPSVYAVVDDARSSDSPDVPNSTVAAIAPDSRVADTSAPPVDSKVRPATYLGTASLETTPASESAPVKSDHLAAAIKEMEQQTQATPQSTSEVQRHAMLRLLYLAAGRQEDALRPVDGVSPTQQDYWSSQLFGLATYLNDTEIPDARRRSAEAKRHLTKAAHKLGEMATLSVRNLAICNEVTSFGVYEQFDPATFEPSQEVLVYAEIDNFRSESTEKGYHTALRSSYLILDNRGQRVAGDDFPIVHDYCRNPRRDFFVRYFVTLPERIYDGEYTLQLMIEDAQSSELGQSSTKFEIDEQGEMRNTPGKPGG